MWPKVMSDQCKIDILTLYFNLFKMLLRIVVLGVSCFETCRIVRTSFFGQDV